MAEEMIEPEPIAPEVASVEQAGPGGVGQKRLSAVLNILKTDFPERYGDVDEKWLSNFISQSPENAGRIRKALMATGRINNLPDNDSDFVNMLKDAGPAPAKPAPQAPVETAETPEVPAEQQPAQTQEAPAPAPAPEPAPVTPPAPVPVPGQPEEPGFFQKALQGISAINMPNLQTAMQIGQTAKNVWDRITGSADAKVDKPATTDAQKLQNYERKIAEFRPIDDEKKRYQEKRKEAIAPQTGFGDLGERSAAAGRAMAGITKEEQNIPVSPESKALLEKHAKAEQEYLAALAQSKGAIEKIAEGAVKKAGLDKLFQYNPGTKHTGFNITEIDRLAKSAAKAAGVPEDGYAYSLIKNRIQGIASFQKNVSPELAKRKPKLEAKIAEAYGKLKTLKDSKTGKVTAANLQEDIKADFTKKFTEAEIIKQKAKEQQLALGKDIKAEGEAEAKPLKDAYDVEFKAIQEKAFSDPEVINFQQNLESQDFDRLQGMVNNGQLTVEKANEILKNEERQKKIAEQTTQFAIKKFGGEFGKAWENYTNSINQVNSRKQAKFKRMRDEIVNSADGELKAAYDQFKTKYKMDPALASLVQKVSQDIYKEEIDNIISGQEKSKFEQDRANGFISNVIDQTMSNLGASLKNFGVIFGSDGLKGFGDIIENNYKLAEYKNDSWMDLFDPTKMAGNTGMLIGRMAPGIITAAGLTAATRGAGLPQATQIMAATLGSWGAETVDMVGGMYNDVLAESGDAIKAKDAAYKLLQGQIAMFPTYTLEVLPFFDVMKGGTLTKALKGGSVEYFTEGVLQEFPQNSMEEAIKNNDEFYNAYRYMNYEKFKETMIATAPSFVFGGAPAAFKGARDYTAKAMAEREAKSFLAKQSLLFNDLNMSQTFLDIQREKGKNFTGALVSNLMTGGQLTKEQADALAIQTENFEKFREFAKKNQLSPLAEKVSFVLFNQYEQADKDGRTEDANRLKTLFNNLLNKKGSAPDLFAVSLPNGDEYFYTYEQTAKLFENDNFKKMLKEGNIALGAWFNDDANPQRVEIDKLYRDALKDEKITDEEVLVDDEEYSRFKNENKVDEERMLAFIDDYLNDVDFSTIPNIDQRYVEMYNHFLPEIKKRAEGLTDETAEPVVDNTVIWSDTTSGGKQEYTFGELQELEKMFKDSYKEFNVKNLKLWFKLDEEQATQLFDAYNKAKEPKVESIPTPTVGQVVIIGGEKGTVIDEGAGKFAIETPTRTIEIPEGKSLEDIGAKIYTEPTQVQGKTAAERLKSKLQQRKDRAKKKVQVVDENTAIIDGKEFRINKDPKGNSIYLTDGKIEIRDENVLIDVDIQRHKLEVKETPEEQERQLQELYSELPPNRRTAVQAIIEKDMTDRIANLLENGITDQTDDTDFLQTRLWAEGRIAELREKESDNAYALDMIEELQNLLNTLWYEHYQKFGREPGAEGAGQIEQADTGEKKTPGVQDTGKERRVANVGDELHDAVGEFGEGVESKMDAEKRLADGEILFGINEQDDSLTELFNEDLAAWPPDTIMAIRPEYLPGATEEGAGKEEEEPSKEFDIDEKIRLVNEQGKPISEFKDGDRVFFAGQTTKRYRAYTEGIVKKVGSEYHIVRFQENPISKKFPVAIFTANTKVAAKPEGEEIYTGPEDFAIFDFSGNLTEEERKAFEIADTWKKMDLALEMTGKQGEKMRADLRAELGDEKFAAMRKITKDFEKIVTRLENDNKIKKDCP